MKWFAVLLLSLTPCHVFAQVSPSCDLEAPTQLAFSSVNPLTLEHTVYGHIQVQCDSATAYQLEVSNAQPRGLIQLRAPGVANPVEATLIQSDSRQPFGTQANGEAIAGQGNGSYYSHPIEAQITMHRVPEPGRYSQAIEIAIIF